MFRKSICVVLIASLVFQIGCSTTKTMLVEIKEYDKLKEEETIFVTVKSGQKYEFVDFEITNTHIIGNSITRTEYTITKKKIEIRLEDIELMQVQETEDFGTANFIGVFLGGYILGYILGFITLIIIFGSSPK